MSLARREFLTRLVAGTALGSLAPGWSALAAGASPTAASRDGQAPRDARDTVLVVLELPGGNDGLNTVVPYEDDAYGRNRTTLRLKPSEVLKIDGQLGWHPCMSGFANLLREGRLAVIQGVGYPRPSGDHEASMRIWQTADPAGYAGAQTGWIGRAIDHAYTADDARSPALYLGETRLPFAFHARRAIVPGVSNLESLRLHDMPGAEAGRARQWMERASAEPRPQEPELLAFLRRSTTAACAASRRIEAVIQSPPASKAEYPRFQLANALRTVAQLIRGDRSIRLYFLEHGGGDIGGYDTHAGQRDNHAALVHQLSESVAAFAADLVADKTLDRVLLMTFSEFGRTVQENGRRGTDHGSAAPMFLVGSWVRGGLIGAHPNLTDLENGGQKFHTDFRRVYATVLDRWLGIDSQAVLGEKFAPVDVVQM